MEDIGLDPDLDTEYRRWREKLGPEDPYAGPNTLGILDVLRAHFLIANFFLTEGEGLGGLGPRDANLLHSALYRQHISLNGRPKWPDKYGIGATLLYGLIMDHPFHDANKRTAFLSTLYCLYRNGRVVTVSHQEFEDLTVEIADHQLGKYARYNDLKNAGDPEPEVEFISYYLRKNTRELDKRYYIVTYLEFARLLRRFGFDLINPSGNYIEACSPP